MKRPVRAIADVITASYTNIRVEVWWLSLIMLINRTGSLVFPFLSLYLIRDLQLTTIQASWILSLFGVGSMLGALVGGYFTDRFGSFIVQLLSLILSGIGWLVLITVRDYHTLLILVPIQSIISDAFRPANISTITYFADKTNLTRSYSLNRMAMNLGFSIGPSIGGVMASISFAWLFVADGVSCILAGIIFYSIFRKWFGRHKKVEPNSQESENPIQGNAIAPHKDLQFLLFILCTILFSTCFFQLLFTLPLYYTEVYGLGEAMAGLILAANGAVIVISEMVFVQVIGSKFKTDRIILIGCLIVGFGFLMLNFVAGIFWLFASMILLSFGEMMTMPFMQTFVAGRTDQRSMGRYMAMYAFSWSVGLILAPMIGMRIIKFYGFESLWYTVMVGSCLVAIVLWWIFNRESKFEQNISGEEVIPS